MEPIPGPRGLPFLGNLLDLRNDEAPLKALEHLADVYGPVYQLTIRGRRAIIVTSAEIMKELIDEKHFIKTPPPALADNPGAQGLFTARGDDPDWGQAHRILMPAFGPLKIEEMFDGMKDIANQLVLKWARKGGDFEIPVTDDYTRLTLDTIALCTMDFRFNSFYQDTMHPFVAAMLNLLSQAGAKQSRPVILSKFLSLFSSEPDSGESVEFMKQTAQEIIETRRNNPTDRKDFLNTLIYGKDPKTGESMRDELISAEMVTFLIAGHETTSGLLSFATLFLLQNPAAYRKAQQEVDSVIGNSKIEMSHLRKLEYLDAVLKETLRLCPTAPGISKSIAPSRQHEFVTIGEGKYHIENTDRIAVILGKTMQDPKVFGEDASEFKPERMLEDNPEYKTYEQYWKPFGNGSRACIGRAFALQEAILALAIILQNFDLKLSDPSYQMRIKQTLTIKPLNLFMKASLRDKITATDLEQKLHRLSLDSKSAVTKAAIENKQAGSSSDEGSLTILYGSNTGTCQALAQKLASEVSTHGMEATVCSMDDRVDKLSTDSPTIIVTSSYEGEPPDNAAHFVEWIESLKSDELKGVKFAVFGCGHRDWHLTFHRIPKLVDEILAARGAERIAEIGVCDCSKGSPIGDFETWLDRALWPALKKEIRPNVSAGQEIETQPQADISTGGRATALRHDVEVGTVKNVKLLTAEGEPAKYHVEIALPPNSTYECGDYLAILPQNPEVNVRKIMAHFQLPLDSTITLASQSFAPLPLNAAISIADLLRNYVELAQPATKRAISTLAKHTTDTTTNAELIQLTTDDTLFQTRIANLRTSVFSLLATHPTITLPFPTFLSLLLPLSVRQYSISSSPLSSPDICTLTFAVLSTLKHQLESQPQDSDQIFYGVASTFLSTLRPGDKIQCAVRRTLKTTFRLPLDAETTPMLMFCAGTGLAPFRGFLQQRAVQKEANPKTKLAKAVLFVGCRSATRDRLHAEELDKWSTVGVVEVKYAFSKEPDHELAKGCRRVSERMAKEKELLVRMWGDGARVYVCGSRAFAENVRQATTSIVNGVVEERRQSGEEVSDEEVERIRARINERAASDIFD